MHSLLLPLCILQPMPQPGLVTRRYSLQALLTALQMLSDCNRSGEYSSAKPYSCLRDVLRSSVFTLIRVLVAVTGCYQLP